MANPPFSMETGRPLVAPVSGMPAANCGCCVPGDPEPTKRGCSACCDITPQAFWANLTAVVLPAFGFACYFYGDAIVGTSFCPCKDGAFPENRSPRNNPRIRFTGTLGNYKVPIAAGDCTTGCRWSLTQDIAPIVEYQSYVDGQWRSPRSCTLGIDIYATTFLVGATRMVMWEIQVGLVALPQAGDTPTGNFCGIFSAIDIWLGSLSELVPRICAYSRTFSAADQYTPDFGTTGAIIINPADAGPPCTDGCADCSDCSACSSSYIASVSYDPSDPGTRLFEGNTPFNHTGAAEACTWQQLFGAGMITCSPNGWKIEFEYLGSIVIRAFATGGGSCPPSTGWVASLYPSDFPPTITL